MKIYLHHDKFHGNWVREAGLADLPRLRCFASLAVNSRGNGGLHKQSKRPATTGSHEKRENSLPSPPIRLIRIASEINEPILESKERKFFAQVLNSGSKVVPAELNRTLGFRSKVNEEKVARVT